MAKNIQHLQHVKSNVVENGAPKLPQPSVLVEGEIAVNYADGYETLSIKTSSGNIATFSSDTIREREELVIAQALNDLNERKLDASAYTPTDLSNYYTKDETSGASEIAEALSAKADTTWVENKERAVAAALVDLNERKADASGVTDLTQAVNTISGDVDTLVDQNEVIAAALVDLDDRKMDASAYTPTDLSNYYNKTDIDNRLGSGITTANNVTKVIEENEVAIAAAIAELDDEKQDALVSGENIKTINQQSLIGSGDIAIEGGFKKFTNPTDSTKVGLVNSLVTTYGTNIGNFAVIEGSGCAASGNYSHAEGSGTTASGTASHAEGRLTNAGGNYSHAEGWSTKASGSRSHAEGYDTSATTLNTHAEGYQTLASGGDAHAEGYLTTASGEDSHAEGYNTLASGTNAHAEGGSTSATTAYTHSEGYQTKATNQYEHASGKHNKSVSASTSFGVSGNTLFSVGNGYGTTSASVHNALDIRQNGDVYIANTDETTHTNYYQKDMFRLQDLVTGFGGFKIKKLTQSEYNALSTKDPNTIYIVV